MKFETPLSLIFDDSKGQIVLHGPGTAPLSELTIVLARSKKEAKDFSQRIDRLSAMLPEKPPVVDVRLKELGT